MQKYFLPAIFLFGVSAAGAKADIYQYVYNGPIDGDKGTAIFDLPSSPSPSRVVGQAFYIDGVSVTGFGQTQIVTVGFGHYADPIEDQYEFGFGHYLTISETNGEPYVSAGGGLLFAGNIDKFPYFTGSVSAPTLALGSFVGYGVDLEVTDIGPDPTPSAVPEPSSLVLFGTGIVGACGAIRRRLSKA